jgi:hypothetical protein
VQILFELCRFRNHHPAFNGQFQLLDTIPDIRDTTLLLPQTFSGELSAPINGSVLGTSSDAQDRVLRDSAVGNQSFRTQTVSLHGSIDGEDIDFLTEVVLDKTSIDVMASMDHLPDECEWCVIFSKLPECFCAIRLVQGHVEGIHDVKLALGRSFDF